VYALNHRGQHFRQSAVFRLDVKYFDGIAAYTNKIRFFSANGYGLGVYMESVRERTGELLKNNPSFSNKSTCFAVSPLQQLSCAVEKLSLTSRLDLSCLVMPLLAVVALRAHHTLRSVIHSIQ